MNKSGFIRSYKESEYLKIKMENLILYGIYLITKNGEACTFEQLVSECFLNFSKVFSFKRYPKWPDSLKFDRPLRKLREKGLIRGSVRDYLSLTEFGEKIAMDTERILNKQDIGLGSKKPPVGRSGDDRLINYLKDAQCFKEFLTTPENFTITEPEFRNLLRCTLETNVEVLRQNLQHYKQVATKYKEKKLFNFLLFCEKIFFKKEKKHGQSTTGKSSHS